MKKRTFTLTLYALILTTILSINAFAYNTYYINGKSIRCDDFSSSQNECWVYANNLYNKIWGYQFSYSFSSSDNMLRNLTDSQITLTQEHLKEYVSAAQLGSCLRICNAEYLHGSDDWGHSQIIVQKDANGFTVLQGGLSASPYRNEQYYTWSGYMNTSWLGGQYSYIKYIKYPNAPAYSGTPTTPKMWCTDINMPSTIIQGKNFNLTGNICGNNGVKWYAIVIYDAKNNPIQNVDEAVWKVAATNSYSINTTAQKTNFSTLAPGRYRLSIQSMDNDNGYFSAYSKEFTVEEAKMWCTDVNMPSTIIQGKNFNLTGNICGNNGVKWCALVIYDAEDNHVQDPSAAVWKESSYSIDSLAQSLDFSTLTPGQYHLSIHCMDYDNGYFVVFSKEFIVTCSSHAYTSTTTYPTCTDAGKTVYTCSVCGNSYEDPIPATGHKWDNGVVTKEPMETATGVKTYTCTVCGTTKTEEIPVLEHSHSYTAVVTAPTCTANGYTTYTCSCGESYSDNYAEALGHNWSSWVIYTNATSTSTGEQRRTCSRCGITESRGLPTLPPASPFTDVPENAYFAAPVAWAVEAGITAGTSPTTFSPMENCTRGQIVTFLWRSKGSPTPKSTVNPFTDVEESSYYYKAVLWAVENGITSGTGENKFSPNSPCTRAQAVTFQWRANEKPILSTENPFEDVQKTDYYYNAVLWAVGNRITAGTSPTEFSPNANCTRAQIVSFLYRDLA